MTEKNKYIIGAITLLILSGSFVLMYDNLRLKIDDDKTTFYAPHEDYSWIWTVVGREKNQLFDGTSMMNRMPKNITREITIDEARGTIHLTRTTPYIRGPVIVDEYYFYGGIERVELFPVYHKITVINGSGYFYRYLAYDLIYDGDRQKLNTTSFNFGRNMKVEWQEDYRWAWIGYPNKKNSLAIQYDVKSDNEVYFIRLFDPPVSLDVTLNYPENLANLSSKSVIFNFTVVET